MIPPKIHKKMGLPLLALCLALLSACSAMPQLIFPAIHADDVFTSWGRETTRAYTQEEITNALNALGDEEKYGMILRAKGIVAGTDGQWIHYDYVPGVPDVRTGSAGTIGRLCVIGSQLNEEAVGELFGVQ